MRRVRNLRLTVQYDGTDYCGFQRQPQVPTIQAVLEDRFGRLLGERVGVIGASRTDAGVHAIGQVVSFTARTTIPTDRFRDAANSVLPDDVVVTEAVEADAGFHARYSAQGKVYRYAIWNAPTCPPTLRRYVWHYRRSLDDGAMRAGAKWLVGTHDFASFAISGSHPASTVRSLRRLACFRRGNLLVMTVEGDGFLRGMVRGIAGTLVEVGRGRFSADDVRTALAARDRGAAGPTAPASGLCLVRVRYY